MTERKEYTKPELKKVKLVREEAVLTNCKNADAGGPTKLPCQSITGPECFEQGS